MEVAKPARPVAMATGEVATVARMRLEDERQQPPRHVDVAARQRERVGLRHVDDLEAPGPGGPIGGRGELAPDRRHVALELGVAHESHRLLDLLRLLGPELGDAGGGDAAVEQQGGRDERHHASDSVGFDRHVGPRLPAPAWVGRAGTMPEPGLPVYPGLGRPREVEHRESTRRRGARFTRARA